MSGRDWDYVYSKFEEVALRLQRSPESLRKALGARVRLIARALKDIEWADSGDDTTSQYTSIPAALGEGDLLAQLILDGEELRAALEAEINRVKETSKNIPQEPPVYATIGSVAANSSRKQ